MSAVADNPAEQHGFPLLHELPEVVRDAMFPDERIVWMQRGHGMRWPLMYTGPLVLCVFVTGTLLCLIAQGSPGLFVITVFGLLFAAPFWAISLLRPIVSPAFEYYVLTDERLLHCTQLITRSTWALIPGDPEGTDDLAVKYICISGSPARGWIVLRHEPQRVRELWPRRNHPASLVGVDQPLEVARLIKSTLKLPFEIEDRTR